MFSSLVRDKVQRNSGGTKSFRFLQVQPRFFPGMEFETTLSHTVFHSNVNKVTVGGIVRLLLYIYSLTELRLLNSYHRSHAPPGPKCCHDSCPVRVTDTLGTDPPLMLTKYGKPRVCVTRHQEWPWKDEVEG
jgi:hypothetical protein